MSDSEPTTVLRSPANPKVRHLLRMRDNRARRRAGRIIVDGWRETLQAIRGGLPLISIYRPENEGIPTEFQSDAQLKAALEDAERHQRLHRVAEPLMNKIAYGQSSRGVVAEFEQPDRRLADLDLPRCPTLLILDGLEKPGNVGAVFRCADAAGVDAVILCQCACDAFNPNAIRSSLGAVFRVPTASTDEAELSGFLITRKIRPVASRVESSRELWSANLKPPVALILGSEAEGLQDRWRKLGRDPIECVRIPMLGEVDSLNASVSAALLAFEAARQRRRQPADR